jgi:IstB-like ATP binding protein
MVRRSAPASSMWVTTDSGTRIPSLNLQTEGAFSKPATVTTDLGPPAVAAEKSCPASASACEVYRKTIELGLSLGRNAIGIWQDLVDVHGFADGYQTAAEELLEIIMRRYERTSTLLTSNRPVDDWGKLLGDSAAVTAMLDRLLHHGHVLKCGPRSWRTKTGDRGETQ